MCKTALITGANRGLGKVLLEKFASHSYDIVAINRQAYEDFDFYSDEIMRKYGVHIYMFYAELSDETAINKIFDELEKRDLKLDVIINNAGININDKPIFYIPYDQLVEGFKINYFAPFLISKRSALMMMRSGGGCIINITSVMSSSRQPGGAIYDASKAALNVLTRSMAQELAPLNIRVNAVACGLMKSGMFESLTPEVQKKHLKKVAMKRAAELSEVADTVYFLASERSSYITGEIIRVDGGYSN